MKLIAKNYGTSIFRAKDRSGNTLRITVHVFDSVVVKNTNVQLDIGEPVTLNVGTQPEAKLVGFQPTFFSSNTIIADVNSDGRPDLIFAINDGDLTVLVNARN